MTFLPKQTALTHALIVSPLPSRAKAHSRPQSQSFLGHVLLKIQEDKNGKAIIWRKSGLAGKVASPSQPSKIFLFLV